MKFFSTLVWIFTLLAFAFFFFSLRTEKNQMVYSLIALGMWGIGIFLNKFATREKEKKA